MHVLLRLTQKYEAILQVRHRCAAQFEFLQCPLARQVLRKTRAKTDRCEACVARLFATREVLVKSTHNPWGIVCASHP